MFLSSGSPANQSERAERVLKFTSKEVHIDNLMDGRLYMNAAGYYHGLPGEQGDPLGASLTYGMDIYANWILPIYRMSTVHESKIANNTVVITRQMIDEFRCAEGLIGIVRYDRLEQQADERAATLAA